MAIKLRIELSDLDPVIWREIVVPDDITLGHLHIAIQGAMGWQNSHLHMFEIKDKRYQMNLDDEFMIEDEALDEDKFKLNDLVGTGSEFGYIYDFGDDWRHAIRVVSMTDETVKNATCAGGEFACPPEDCGGPFMYPDVIDALEDEDHPEHENISEWAEGFDPVAFDLAEANAHMKELRRYLS